MSNEAESAVRRAIRDHGPITFAEFMETALYGAGGYYRGGSPISATGDYFTSPSAHPLFGALIAVQLHEMWSVLETPNEFVVIEEGAGNGGLAADVVSAANELDSGFVNALKYSAFDVVPPARQHYPVEPISDAPRGVTGCVLSNELLDALPVHRFEILGDKVLEVFVAEADDGDCFLEVLGQPSTPLIAERVGPFLDGLPDGYRGEVCAGIEPWAARQSQALERGWVLTIDYGFDRATLYKPERAEGSLRCYFQHTLGQDPLAHVGRQDITAHVDFTAVDEAMQRAGFASAGTTSQAEFLRQLGFDDALEKLRQIAPDRATLRANELGAKSLIDPDGMGRFVVTCHSRGVPETALSGFGASAGQPTARLGAFPLLNPERHINLTGVQQSSGYFEVQSLEELFSDEP